MYVYGRYDRRIHIIDMNHLSCIGISYIFPPCRSLFHLLIAIFDRHVSYNAV